MACPYLHDKLAKQIKTKRTVHWRTSKWPMCSGVDGFPMVEEEQGAFSAWGGWSLQGAWPQGTMASSLEMTGGTDWNIQAEDLFVCLFVVLSFQNKSQVKCKM